MNCRSNTHTLCPHLIPTSLVASLLRQSSTSEPRPDHVTSRGRNSVHAQHQDNDSHTPPFLRPSSVVVTTDPADVSTMVVTSEHREVQHTTVLCYLYKNDAFCPIPTSSCVLAFIANNKGTLNPPACSLLFKYIYLSLSLSLTYLLLRLRSSVSSLVSVVTAVHALRQSLTQLEYLELDYVI
jgi:hypothetical protein